MKKTIVIIILAVFIASIAIVNFFGLEILESDHVDYIKMIQCDTVILRNDSNRELDPVGYVGPNNDIPKFEFTFEPPNDGNSYTDDDDSILLNPNRIELIYHVFNENNMESDRLDEVAFEYDEEAMAGIAVFREDIHSLIFLKPNSTFTITLRSTDGKNVSTTVKISAVQDIP